jgi:cholesterol oxidase
MLDGQRYPFDQQPYAHTSKTIAFRAAAEELRAEGTRLSWYLPLLAVAFANRNPDGALLPAEPGQLIVGQEQNLHAAQRSTCRLCGECDAGCNYGAKNTLDYNYLSAAWRNGADIRDLSEVKRIAPRPAGRGYVVEYLRHDAAQFDGQPHDTARLPLHAVTADRLVLSAGTLGTTYLLLRNRAAFPALSPCLGERFSTNGDLLSFASRATDSKGTRVLDPSRGPVITSTIRVGDALDGEGDTGRGFYLQDAGYPEFFNWVIETANGPGIARRAATFGWRRLKQWWTGDPDSELSAQVADLIGAGDSSIGSMPLLGMGRDVPDGKMSLRAGRNGAQYLAVDWRNRRSGPYFDAVTDLSRRIAGKLGARFIENPDTRFLKRLITVHALGGCPMGRGPAEGVVDAKGGVFGYPGLYIADGSIMPGPVGANPSLTIAALADAFADDIVQEFRAQRQATPASPAAVATLVASGEESLP